MPIEDDASMPNLNAASRHGPMPSVIRGRYSSQVDWAIAYIHANVDLNTESVAFLKPLGGGWFDTLRQTLSATCIRYKDITRDPEWPQGEENVALCTFHSAKGLEFDHVFILGLSKDTAAYPDTELDDKFAVLQRLMAVAVARARKTVTLGYKVGEESGLVRQFESGTFRNIDL